MAKASDNKKETKDTVKKITRTNMDDRSQKVIVRGARTHNLRDMSVEMPRGAMTAITGPSGSGMSSLAFDTIFAE